MQKYHDEPRQYKGYLKSALEPRISPGISRFRIFDRLGGVVETAGNAIEKDFNPPHFEGLKTPGKRHLTTIS